MNDPLRLPCPTCSGTRSTTTGDRHADTNMDVCATCRDEGTIPARPGESPEASFNPKVSAVAGEGASLRDDLIGRIAAAIDAADAGCAIRLTGLDGDASTYTLDLGDGEPLTFTDAEDAREHALKVRSLARARAAAAALDASTTHVVAEKAGRPAGIEIQRIGADGQGVSVIFARSEYDSEAHRYEEPLFGMVVVLDVDGTILSLDVPNLTVDMTRPLEGGQTEKSSVETQAASLADPVREAETDEPICYACDKPIGDAPFHTHPEEGDIHEACCGIDAPPGRIRRTLPPGCPTPQIADFNRGRLAGIAYRWDATGRLDDGSVCFLIRMARSAFYGEFKGGGRA